MKLLIAVCLIAVVAARPGIYTPGINNAPRINYPTDNVQITRYENEYLGPGHYRYLYEQTDGQRAQQVGQIKNEGREDEALAVSGSFSWVAPNGVTYTVNYTADEDGYKPEIEQGPGAGVPNHVASLLG